jgi:DNA-binding NarL/FixJ family response regulator
VNTIFEEGGTMLIVDPDRKARAALVKLLERAGFETSEAESGEEALAVVRSKLPWLVLLDVCLPDFSGYEVCRELRDEFGEELSIVFLSGDRTEPIDRATGLLVGGDDYIVEPFDTGELLARVRRLAQRMRAKTESHNMNGMQDPAAHAPAVGLTRRELEVLTALALGYRARDIAARLVISEKTVASHLQRVLSKLGVNTRAQAVALAYRNGLIVADGNAADGSGDERLETEGVKRRRTRPVEVHA